MFTKPHWVTRPERSRLVRAAGGVQEVGETPRLLPRSGRGRHPGLGEQPLVVEKVVPGPLLREGVLASVKGEAVIQRPDAVRLQFGCEGLIAGQHRVEVQQHASGGQLGIREVPRHQYIRAPAAGAERRQLLHHARSRKHRANLDVGVAALELVDDADPGIAFVGVGREEERQRVVFGSAAGGPRCQRCRGERAGTAQQAAPPERLIEHGAPVLARLPAARPAVSDVLGTRCGCGVAGLANSGVPERPGGCGRDPR